MTITTGDGKVYRPSWMGSTKETVYNVREFNFIDIPGGYVDRKEPKARRFSFKILFQGENNLVDSNVFEKSANDRRAWVVSHPQYDSLTVHPTALKYNDEVRNVTEITGILVETLPRFYPITEVEPTEEIKTKSDETAEGNLSFADNEVEIDSTIIDNNTALYNQIKEQVPTDDSEAYLNALNEANAKLFEATSDASQRLEAFNSTQDYLLAPAFFVLGVRTRVNMLVAQLNELIFLLPNTVDKVDKLLFEYQGNAILNASGLSVSALIDGDLENANDALELAALITTGYQAYVASIDALQTSNNYSINSYSPNQSIQQSLNGLINFTISNLLTIALNGRQERRFLTYSDSNIYELAHRVYGLDANDENIQELITQNNWGINSYLQVPYNTEVIYYV